MYKIVSIILIFGFILGWSCATIMPGKTPAHEDVEYSEDLTDYRAKPLIVEPANVDVAEVFVRADSTAYPVNKKIDIVLDTAAAYNRATIKYIDGFTIQVYAGNDRAMASEVKLDIIRNLPEMDPIMVFEQPNYKVRVGQYYTRLEAQQTFEEIKSVFSKAILIPNRIPVQ